MSLTIWSGKLANELRQLSKIGNQDETVTVMWIEDEGDASEGEERMRTREVNNWWAGQSRRPQKRARPEHKMDEKTHPWLSIAERLFCGWFELLTLRDQDRMHENAGGEGERPANKVSRVGQGRSGVLARRRHLDLSRWSVS